MEAGGPRELEREATIGDWRCASEQEGTRKVIAAAVELEEAEEERDVDVFSPFICVCV